MNGRRGDDESLEAVNTTDNRMRKGGAVSVSKYPSLPPFVSCSSIAIHVFRVNAMGIIALRDLVPDHTDLVTSSRTRNRFLVVASLHRCDMTAAHHLVGFPSGSSYYASENFVPPRQPALGYSLLSSLHSSFVIPTWIQSSEISLRSLSERSFEC